MVFLPLRLRILRGYEKSRTLRWAQKFQGVCPRQAREREAPGICLGRLRERRGRSADSRGRAVLRVRRHGDDLAGHGRDLVADEDGAVAQRLAVLRLGEVARGSGQSAHDGDDLDGLAELAHRVFPSRGVG